MYLKIKHKHFHFLRYKAKWFKIFNTNFNIYPKLRLTIFHNFHAKLLKNNNTNHRPNRPIPYLKRSILTTRGSTLFIRGRGGICGIDTVSLNGGEFVGMTVGRERWIVSKR